METHPNDVEAQALRLDDEKRARLAVTLIHSLDSDERLSRDQVDALWLKEAEERLRLMDSGQDPGVDPGNAIAEARQNLRR
jgi:hypothetical protein